MKNVVLLSMFFLHIVDDYYLQGVLANLKQRKWWRNNAPDKLYRYDYLIALVEHAFSWSFMIHIPIMIYFKGSIALLPISIIVNMMIHAFIDDLKANKRIINLITDQIFHFIQIIITYWLYF